MSGFMQDKELGQYRDLVKPLGYFEDGFNWRTAIGTMFVALIMLPASMYMHLMIGEASLGPAAQWVTVILFLEMAKRARTFLKPAEIFVLQSMIAIFIGLSPVEGFFWRQYIVQSDAARSFGLADSFPAWFAPVDQSVLDQRTFFTWEWFVPLLLLFITQVVGRIDSLILGYGLFRVTSDVEKLPFPMAPIAAMGVMAITENATGKEGWRWRCFSIASAMGMAFGAIYIAVPTITGTFLKEPFQILPIPWLDTTTNTEGILPATATGLSFDMANFFAGMAFPFWSVVGSFAGLVVTFVLNPYLYEWGILTTWTPGMSTVETMFANNVDFYLSFGIGISIAVALIGIYQTIASYRYKSSDGGLDAGVAQASATTVTKGVARGDIRTLTVVLVYVISSAFYIWMAGYLLGWNWYGEADPNDASIGLFWILIFFALVYTPLLSYVTARLEGVAGQVIALPMVKEVSFILSGYKGIEIWLLPIPLYHNYGTDVVNYRVSELVGCTFRSIWKMNFITLPIVFIFSLIYGEFIWSLAPIPSVNYPFAQEMWDLHARNQMLAYSATSAGFSPFMNAIVWEYIAAGAGAGVLVYVGLGAFGLPLLLLYGTVKGLGQTMPQFVVTQMIGALFGRLVMERRFGVTVWRQYALVLFAGFNCGAGLIMMFATGVKFLASSVFQLPF
jgi:hypothetical protein